ncbi:MAG: pyrroline-5-carboxylate reductase [Parvularculaceae bacterium]|nr:pyrroline-5-carboxylate reductase [Parvularculaceae bacterium]
METNPAVLLIGAGAMGGALLRGWIAARTIDFPRSAVVDPAGDDLLRALVRDLGVAINPHTDDRRFDVVVVAVKPQSAAAALPAYAAAAKDAVVVSVMAGASVETVSRMLGGARRIVRAMPNLPASIGAGVAGLYADPGVDEEARRLAERLMAAVGETLWVDREELVAAVTAISGSGPAYFFLLTEALVEAGRELGLSKEAAEKLARSTAEGAGAMLAADSRTPAQMRRAVTSPGGTTAAALDVLEGENQQFRTLMKQAASAAARRARELTE